MAKKQINFQRLHYLPLKMCFGDWNQVMKTHFATDGTLDKLLLEGRQ